MKKHQRGFLLNPFRFGGGGGGGGGAASYLYWRLYVTANDGDADYTSVSEFELIVSGSNVINTATSSANSSSDGGSDANAAKDGDINTEWVTASGSATPSWISYGFGSAIAPTAFAITSQRVVTGRTPTAFKLQGNNDGLGSGEAWVDVAEITSSTGWAIQERRAFAIDDAVTFSDVVYFLRGVGTNGGTTFTDSSSAARTVSVSSTVTTSTAQKKFLSSSIFFDADGNLTTPSLSLTLPFYIRLWIYPTASNPIGLFDTGPGQTQVLRNYGAGVIERQGAGVSVTFAPTANVWTWVEMEFSDDGGNLNLDLYFDGSLQSSTNIASGASFTQGTTFVVGGINNGGDGRLEAYVSEFQVVSGTLTSAVPFGALPTS